jgi:hypothetical protein
VRFRTRTLQPIRIAASVLVSLLLASCISYTGTVPYPASWAPVRQGQAVGSCPKIDGVYWDRGQYQPTPYVSGRPCNDRTGECRSLIFNLLGDARSTLFKSETPRDWVARVQIEQPSPGIVEIIAEPGGKRQTLSTANGDFTCDKNGLRLRDTTAATILLIGNVLSTESRIFNVADDGSLIVKAVWHNRGHATLFPLSITNELLVRWTRVDPEHSGSQTVITQPPN